jgi:hypothetical protein
VFLVICVLLPSPAVALASTFLVLDVSAATCLTRQMLWLIAMFVVLLDIARVALPHATTNAENVRVADPNSLLTRPHLHAAR